MRKQRPNCRLKRSSVSRMITRCWHSKQSNDGKAKGMTNLGEKFLFLHIIHFKLLASPHTKIQQYNKISSMIQHFIYLSSRMAANSNLVSNHDSSTNLCTWYCTFVKKNCMNCFTESPVIVYSWLKMERSWCDFFLTSNSQHFQEAEDARCIPV